MQRLCLSAKATGIIRSFFKLVTMKQLNRSPRLSQFWQLYEKINLSPFSPFKTCVLLNHGIAAIGLLVLLIITMSPATAYSAVKCSTPDRSFKEFLLRFEENIEFQRSRIVLPMVARFGDFTMTDVVIELWGSEKLMKLDYPLILSAQGRKKEHVMESILLSTKRYTEVFHDGPPESDLYRVLYKFRNIDGCWFLEEMHDKSK